MKLKRVKTPILEAKKGQSESLKATLKVVYKQLVLKVKVRDHQARIIRVALKFLTVQL